MQDIVFRKKSSKTISVGDQKYRFRKKNLNNDTCGSAGYRNLGKSALFRYLGKSKVSESGKSYSFSILFEKAKAWSGCNMLNLSRLFIFRDFGIKNGHGIIPRKGFWTVWDKYQSWIYPK